MDKLKQYLPLIIVAIVGLYVIRKFGSGGSGPNIRQVIPLTPSSDTSYTDTLLPFRAQAFEGLIGAGIAQTQAETREKELNLESLRLSGELESARNITDLGRQQAGYEFELGKLSIAQRLQIALRQFDILEILGLKESETELAKTSLQTELAKYLQSAQLTQQQFLENSYLHQLELYYQQRDQDRQVQQSAINRTISGRNTSDIVGSIAQAVSNIFGGRVGGGVGARTPTTFPSSFGF